MVVVPHDRRRRHRVPDRPRAVPRRARRSAGARAARRRRREDVVAVHGGFVEVARRPGDRPLRRGRAARADRRRARARRAKETAEAARRARTPTTPRRLAALEPGRAPPRGRGRRFHRRGRSRRLTAPRHRSIRAEPAADAESGAEDLELVRRGVVAVLVLTLARRRGRVSERGRRVGRRRPRPPTSGPSAGSAPGSTSTTTARSSSRRRGALPAVTPASVDDMARLGVRTLYLQAAQDDTRSEGTLVDRQRSSAQILRRAHRRGVKVVAWYLPHFADVDRDLASHPTRCTASARSGQRFDGIALDIEWTSDVKDSRSRNRALAELRGTGPALGDRCAARRDRARAGAARGRQPGVLAELPVEDARPLVRRVDADELLDQPHGGVRLARRVPATRARTSAGCAPTSAIATAACTPIGGIADQAEPAATSPAFVPRPRRRRARSAGRCTTTPRPRAAPGPASAADPLRSRPAAPRRRGPACRDDAGGSVELDGRVAHELVPAVGRLDHADRARLRAHHEALGARPVAPVAHALAAARRR